MSHLGTSYHGGVSTGLPIDWGTPRMRAYVFRFCMAHPSVGLSVRFRREPWYLLGLGVLGLGCTHMPPRYTWVRELGAREY